MNIGAFLTKTAGIVGLCAVVYDSNNHGKYQAVATQRKHKVDNLEQDYLNVMRLDSPSAIKGNIKTALFQYSLDENLSGFFTNIGGYIKGFSSMLVSNAIPLGLSVGAILTKGIASKLFGVGLAIYGGIFLLQEGLGIGRAK